MLNLAQVSRIRELLDSGFSCHKIARITGIHRNTIAAIDSGRHCSDFGRRHRESDAYELGPVARCPTCGGLVFMPCVFCRTRAWLAKSKLS